MREAGVPGTEDVSGMCYEPLCPSHRGKHGPITRGPAQRRGAQRESRTREGSTKRGQRQYKGRSPVDAGQSIGRATKVRESAAKDRIGAGVLHLEHSVRILSFARIATTLLHVPLRWVTILLYPTASERGECMLALCSSGYSQHWRW